jgi:hypothetical protein
MRALLLALGLWLANVTAGFAASPRWDADEALVSRLLTGGADAPALQAAFAKRDDKLDVSALRLGAAAWLVALNGKDDHDVFIAQSRNGGYATAWRLADVEPATDQRALGAWTAAGQADDCRIRVGDANWADCGPISPEFGALPAGPGGAARFWVNGIYFQEAGETESGQLSVWQWDFQTARPLLVRVYGFLLDRDVGPSVTGDLLRLTIKDDFKTMPSCGACAGRQRIWSFRLTPTGAADLGQRSVTPELDLIDDLYDRALHHQPLGVSSAVAKVIARQAAQADHGLLGSPSWELSRDRRRLCLATDLGGAAEFTLGRAGGRTRVMAARYLGDGFCSDFVHWPGALAGS